MSKPQIALQLYTLRDAMVEDIPITLSRIAELGFDFVESAFFPEGVTTQQAAAELRNAGLRVCSAHCEIPVGDQQEAVLEIVDAFDCDSVVWHGWPEDPDYATVDGVKRLAVRYNEANAICQAHGKRFGIHNHWWEFRDIDGIYPYEILAEEMEPSIFFEIDTYWAKTAGVDPIPVLQMLGHRAPLIHIKDGPATIEGDMVAAGQGIMDIPAIIEASNDYAEWYIIELDRCATDMFEAVAQSRTYLSEVLS
ncbi:MAG: sugar phosphate isomerase/epimerase [Chloroflexota bacterium]